MAPRKNTTDEQKIADRIRQAARRLRMKADPVQAELMKQKEREKYAKKEKGQVKLVSQMTAHERRAARKRRKEYMRQYREKKKEHAAIITASQLNEPSVEEELEEVSDHPPSPLGHDAQSNGPTPSRQAVAGKRKSRKNREKSAKKIKYLGTTIKDLKRKVKSQGKTISRLRDLVLRATTDPNSPGKIVRAVMEESDPTVLKKKLLFGEVIQQELSQNVKSLTNQAKRDLTKTLVGDGTKMWKYDLLSECSSIIARRAVDSAVRNCSVKPKNIMKLIQKQLKEDITKFLEEDENSRCLPGKKDYISRKGIRKQKRLLLEDLKDLHKKFQAGYEYKVSYPTFCRFRPFWVLPPDVSKRETCLCHTHANFELRLEALRRSKVISSCKVSRMKEQVCCVPPTIDCYHHKCLSCRGNTIIYGEEGAFDGSQLVALHQWTTVTVQYLDPKTRKNKQTKRTVKSVTEIPLLKLIQETEEKVNSFLEHEGNVFHQHNAIKYLKDSLECDETLIHCDFSENYATKYSSEIQAIHFGGNRQSVSLHTVVIYMKEDDVVTPFSLCTVSQNLDHGLGAIWAHMQPMFAFINCQLNEFVTKVHFLSDGPSTQYRNKTVYYLLQHRLRNSFPRLTNATWNYSEAGHGKGAPDGVGGTIKRTADKVVAQEHDITDVDSLIFAMSNKLQNVLLFKVENSSIQNMTDSFPRDVSPFKGTMKVHQVVWRKGKKLLQMNKLSCFVCPNLCKHHSIGQHVSRPHEIENEEQKSDDPKTVRSEEQQELTSDSIILLPDQLGNNNFINDCIIPDGPAVLERMEIEESFSKTVDNEDRQEPNREPSAVKSGLCFHCGGTITVLKRGLTCEVCAKKMFHESCKVIVPSTSSSELQWFDCCQSCLKLLG